MRVADIGRFSGRHLYLRSQGFCDCPPGVLLNIHYLSSTWKAKVLEEGAYLSLRYIQHTSVPVLYGYADLRIILATAIIRCRCHGASLPFHVLTRYMVSF